MESAANLLPFIKAPCRDPARRAARRLLYINPHSTLTTLARQLDLYKRALDEYGKPFPAELPMRREVFVAGTREEAIRLAQLYLQSPPGPPLGLAETVLAEMRPSAGKEAIRRYIVARIRRELQDGLVISVDGWIMSPTEAQLCGLAAAGGTP